jgi:hypothetical protein
MMKYIHKKCNSKVQQKIPGKSSRSSDLDFAANEANVGLSLYFLDCCVH